LDKLASVHVIDLFLEYSKSVKIIETGLGLNSSVQSLGKPWLWLRNRSDNMASFLWG